MNKRTQGLLRKSFGRAHIGSIVIVSSLLAVILPSGCQDKDEDANAVGFGIQFIDSSHSQPLDVSTITLRSSLRLNPAARWQSFRLDSLRLPIRYIAFQSGKVNNSRANDSDADVVFEDSELQVGYQCRGQTAQCAFEHTGQVGQFTVGLQPPSVAWSAIRLNRCSYIAPTEEAADIEAELSDSDGDAVFNASLRGQVNVGNATLVTSEEGLTQEELASDMQHAVGHCVEVLPFAPHEEGSEELGRLRAYYDSSFMAHAFVPSGSNMDDYFDNGRDGNPGYCGAYPGLGKPFVCIEPPPFFVTDYLGELQYQRYIMGGSSQSPTAYLGIYLTDSGEFKGGFIGRLFVAGKDLNDPVPSQMRVVSMTVNDDEPTTFRLTGSKALSGDTGDFIVPYFAKLEVGQSFTAKYATQFSSLPRDLWVKRLD